MTDAGAAHLATARKLLSAVLESDPTSLAETLAEQVTYQALGKTLQGAQDVSTELRSEAFGQVWRQLRWDAPQTAASAVRLIGERQPSLGERGVIVTLHFEGERIVQILQQRVPPPPPNPQPMVLPEALREAIDGNLLEKHPMVLAYVGEDAQPVQSFRGSTQVLSKDQLAMWVRNPQGAFVRASRCCTATRRNVPPTPCKAAPASSRTQPYVSGCLMPRPRQSGRMTSPCWASRW